MNVPTGSPVPHPGKAHRSGLNHNIHGARGLFSFLLFVFHVANSGLPHLPLPYYEWVKRGADSLAFGVELFFIISGIVILGAFRRAKSLPGFLADRATRILPTLWAAVAVMTMLTAAGSDVFTQVDAGPAAAAFAANLLAMPPVVRGVPLIHPAAWSLSYEFAFYLLFVVFGLIAGFFDRRVALAVVLVLFVVVFWYHVRATYFLAGLVIGAGWMAHPRLRPLLRFPLLWMLLFLFSWEAVAYLVGDNIHAAIWSRLAGDPLLLALALVAFLSALMAMSGIEQGFGWISAFLRTPVMQWLGTISFSLYLWQTPVMAVVKRLMYEAGLVDAAGWLSQPLFFLIALPPTLAVSALSQHSLEIGVTNWLRSQRTLGPATHLHQSERA